MFFKYNFSEQEKWVHAVKQNSPKQLNKYRDAVALPECYNCKMEFNRKKNSLQQRKAKYNGKRNLRNHFTYNTCNSAA